MSKKSKDITDEETQRKERIKIKKFIKGTFCETCPKMSDCGVLSEIHNKPSVKNVCPCIDCIKLPMCGRGTSIVHMCIERQLYYENMVHFDAKGLRNFYNALNREKY